MANNHVLAVDGAEQARIKPAIVIFVAFLFAVYFLNGGISNALAFTAFGASWVLVAQGARNDGIAIPTVSPIAIVFLIAIVIRLMLPPYGDPEAIPGTAVSRVVLLVGLFGLVLYVYTRLPFEQLLWLIAGVAVACCLLAVAVDLSDGRMAKRLTFLGRASHPIFGAGAISAGLLAAVTLLIYRPANRTLLVMGALAAMIAVLSGAVFLSGSRGPMIAVAIALVATPVVLALNWRWLFVTMPFAAWAAVSSTVLLEPVIKHYLCPAIQFACRRSQRQDVWVHSLEQIGEHPLWGSGYGFRFEGVPHAHNGFLGVGLNYGLVIFLLFACLLGCAAANIRKFESRQERFFLLAMLTFAGGFMGSDLSDPMRFFNTHYVFLWLPLFIALIGPEADRPASAG